MAIRALSLIRCRGVFHLVVARGQAQVTGGFGYFLWIAILIFSTY